MLKNEFLLQNPLRLMAFDNENILPEGGFGAVLARAGVGKTALLVQLALNSLLQNKNVLHISLNDPVKKVSLWYKEVFHHLTKSNDVKQSHELWESILPHRFIMTFKAEGFSVPKLEERLADLKEQNIFSPQALFIDGLAFDESQRKPLCDLKAFAENNALCVWFTAQTHRHEEPGPNGLPVQLQLVADLFDAVIQLQPEGKEIYLKVLKGGAENFDTPVLQLDPSTMLLKNKI
ncbi:MAG: AAA family ATPase [Proteobacteria bacterium]|nr:AAA family ATPase [Pseudomonadota bacterium]